MNKYSFFFLLLPVMGAAQEANHIVYASQDLLLAVRTQDQKTADSLTLVLARLSPDVLANALTSDASKKAFWLNVYNAVVQRRLRKNVAEYKNRDAFFSQKSVTVAAQSLSLDDIENGILRRSKIKISLGYLSKMSVTWFEQRMRVQQLDARIHFALNCGAKSCPAIAYYETAKIDEQLNVATQVYLKQEVVRHSAQSATVPILFSWFRADFGGLTGVVRFLKTHKIILPNDAPQLRFKPYDWTVQLGVYRQQ